MEIKKSEIVKRSRFLYKHYFVVIIRRCFIMSTTFDKSSLENEHISISKNFEHSLYSN